MNGGNRSGAQHPTGPLDFTLDFEGCRIQASWSLEAARTISSHSCHVDRGLRSKTREVTNSFASLSPLLTLTWDVGRQIWGPDEKCFIIRKSGGRQGAGPAWPGGAYLGFMQVQEARDRAGTPTPNPTPGNLPEADLLCEGGLCSKPFNDETGR